MKTRNSAAVLLLVCLSLLFLVACASGPAPAVNPTPTSPASRSAVTAKGTVAPLRYARISFSTGGTLKLNVKEGDTVQAGGVLAELDTQDLELQVRTAQDALDVATKTLAQAQVPASAEEVAAAQAAYDSAAAALQRAQRGPTAEELAILKANLSKAKAALDQAQAAYDRAGGATNPYAPMLPTSLQLQAATLDYQIAQANYDKAVKRDDTSIAQAQAAVTQAKAALDLKQKGPRPEDIAVVQARVQQAQTGLDQARQALTKARLSAPFAGTVTAVYSRSGELVQPGSPVLTLADLSQLRVETTDLDEFGAARVILGQPCNITVNAYGDKRLTGKVTNIGYQSVTLPTGDISYVVVCGLDNQDSDLRWGMTVKVEFASESK